MNKTIWITALALSAGGGCKRSETEQRAVEMRKAQERVEDKRQDVRDEAKEMAEQNREMAREMEKQAGKVIEEGQEVAKQGEELTEAERKLAAARAQLDAAVGKRLAVIDDRLAVIDGRTDPVSKQLAIELHAKRDLIRVHMKKLDSVAGMNWDDYQAEVEDNLKVLETDLDKALGLSKP